MDAELFQYNPLIPADKLHSFPSQVQKPLMLAGTESNSFIRQSYHLEENSI